MRATLALFLALVAAWAAPAAAAEPARLVLGLAGQSANYLTVQLAAERGPLEEGLTLEVISFAGGSQVATAVAAGSIDVALASLDTLVTVLGTGQPLRAFYAGFNLADHEWFARPEIRTWRDLAGRTMGVSAPGSLSDFLTRHLLRRHGLEPGRDVQLRTLGGANTRWQALRTGRVDAAALSAPARWQAAAAGFTRLGAQRDELGPTWPTNVMFTRLDVLERRPAAIRALLRAHVAAIRLARADRELAIGVLQRHLKFDRPHAERAYAEAIDSFDERGALPAAAMPAFWRIAVEAGEVDAPWPEARFLDRRFIDSFPDWAPR